LPRELLSVECQPSLELLEVFSKALSESTARAEALYKITTGLRRLLALAPASPTLSS